MKRYRLFNFDLDSRAATLDFEIQDSWDDTAKILHERNKNNVIDSLVNQYGRENIETKIYNLKELGSSPLSIIAFHNKFLHQIRNSFVIGSYYPALTGACALGERILNYLLLILRDDYKSTTEYKHVYKQKSFDNWEVPINTLFSWNILLSDVKDNFLLLESMRNKSIHFREETDKEDRSLALQAINLISKIASRQFGFFGTQPWFIENTRGSFYIKKSWETNPFIKNIYLPNCVYVGPNHSLSMNPDMKMKVTDVEYEEKDISDEEFVELLEKSRI